MIAFESIKLISFCEMHMTALLNEKEKLGKIIIIIIIRNKFILNLLNLENQSHKYKPLINYLNNSFHNKSHKIHCSDVLYVGFI